MKVFTCNGSTDQHWVSDKNGIIQTVNADGKWCIRKDGSMDYLKLFKCKNKSDFWFTYNIFDKTIGQISKPDIVFMINKDKAVSGKRVQMVDRDFNHSTQEWIVNYI